MVAVDSSVWIDFFNGIGTVGRATLRRLLTDGETTLVIPDLVLYEVLRGFRDEREYLQARRLLSSLSVETTGGADFAQRAADHWRSLRAAGITVRNSIDVLIATFCIDRGYILLHNDRDFQPFATHRGLRVWQH